VNLLVNELYRFATKLTSVVGIVTRTRQKFYALQNSLLCNETSRVFAVPPSSSMYLRINSFFVRRNYSVY